MLIGNGVGHENDRLLQGIRDFYCPSPRYAHVPTPSALKTYKCLIREADHRNSGLGAHAIQHAEVR